MIMARERTYFYPLPHNLAGRGFPFQAEEDYPSNWGGCRPHARIFPRVEDGTGAGQEQRGRERRGEGGERGKTKNSPKQKKE